MISILQINENRDGMHNSINNLIPSCVGAGHQRVSTLIASEFMATPFAKNNSKLRNLGSCLMP